MHRECRVMKVLNNTVPASGAMYALAFLLARPDLFA